MRRGDTLGVFGALAVILLSACADLAEIGGPCGNYVVDSGEDCDAGPNGSGWCTAQCQLVCQASQCLDGSGQPVQNYACGVDGMCHAPGGVLLGESGSSPFTPISAATTDINGDGIADLVGVTLDTEVVLFGDRGGTLQNQTTTLVPGTSGLGPTFGDIEGDGHLDVLVPTPNGMVAMTSSAGVPLPFPFVNTVARRAPCQAMVAPRGVIPFDEHHMITVVAQDGALAATVLDLDTAACVGGFVASCGLADPAANPMGGVTTTVYPTTAITPTPSVVLAVSDGMQVCVMTVIEDTSGNFQIIAGGVVANVAVQQGGAPVLAQIDGTTPACPELVVGDAMGTWKYPGKPVAGGCAVDTSATPTLLFPMGYLPSGSVTVKPQIAGAAPDLLAVTFGSGIGGMTALYAYVSTAPQLVFQSTESLPVMVEADLDGDGVTEIVAASRFAPDFQILYRTQSPDGFLVDRVPTDGVPVTAVLRDFDGNGLPDIAFMEALTSGSRLEIAYSTRDRPLPPVAVASFADTVIALLPVQTPDVLDPFDQIEDLVVLELITLPGATHPVSAITLLHGSPERSMFAYLDPRPQSEVPTSKFESVLAGSFFSAAPSAGTSAPTDLVAIELDTSRGTFVWNLPNQGGVIDSEFPEQPLPGIVYANCTATDTLCGLSAVYTTMRIGDRDVVLAVDAFHHLVTIDPGAGPGSAPALTSSTLIDAMPEAPGADTLVFRPLAADLDGDGRPELVLPFRANEYKMVSGARVVVCHLSEQGLVLDCTNLGATGQPLSGYDCSDVGAGRVTDRGRLGPYAGAAGLDLVVTCQDASTGEGAVFALHGGLDGSYIRTKLLDVFGFYVQVGDVTGDGVDDVMLLSADSIRSEPAIHVFPQCDSHAACAVAQ